MASFQTDILGAIAKIVGGAQPDATGNPYWYSGAGGIAGINGCYSVPPETIQVVPVGVVVAHEFETEYYPGHTMDKDMVRLLVLVRRNDSRTQTGLLNPFRDSVPDAFFNVMRLNNATNVWQALVKRGRTAVIPWGAIDYLGWEFEIDIDRNSNQALSD